MLDGPPPYLAGPRDLCLVRADAPGPDNRAVEEERLGRQAGFSRVLQQIADARVPVLGHNVWLDLCFVLNQFVAPLPSEVHEFLMLARQTFASVVDTKVLAGKFRVRDTKYPIFYSPSWVNFFFILSEVCDVIKSRQLCILPSNFQ